jgi:hypothetical protein
MELNGLPEMSARAGQLDWKHFGEEMAAALVAAVQRTQRESPGEHFYAAGLFGIYRELGAGIALPELALNTDEVLADRSAEDREELRWSPADWDHFVDWLEPDRHEYWSQAVTAEAAGTERHWKSTVRRYLGVLAQACREARKTLQDSGDVDSQFVVLIDDDEEHERLIRRCLTPAEIRRWFPQFDAHAWEVARIQALPQNEQVGVYLSRLDAVPGAIDWEEAAAALRALGPVAVPGLLGYLNRRTGAGPAVRLLIEIGQADDAVISALATKLTRCTGTDQLWVARALAQFGQLDVVLKQEARIPDQALVVAVGAPLSGSREHLAAPRPLTYAPLEAVIDRRPDLVGALAEELRPGGVMVRITAAEVDAALAGLASPHVMIRQHAVCLLGDPRLGRKAAPKVLARLAELAGGDPEPNVRRLAVLALQYWGPAAADHADVITAARADPDPAVRDTAERRLNPLM